MSTLIGTESERWSLPRAIDALAESARQAGHPGMVWLAGLVYTLTVGLGFGWDSGLVHSIEVNRKATETSVLEVLRDFPEKPLQWGLVVVPCLGVLLLPLFRMTAGLARVGPASAWQAACHGRRTPPLRAIWAEGKGLAVSTFGLWAQLALMIAGAAFLGSLPVSALARTIEDPSDDLQAAAVMGALLVPIVIVLVGYALVLSVLNQFALHSLAHNRRGVYSALLHGWRIMRNDGWATARAVLVDLILLTTIALGWTAVSGFGNRLGKGGHDLAVIVNLVLTGFAGVTRAGYWARAYRALGGLAPDDGVPGL
jgi:hypothetical protein